MGAPVVFGSVLAIPPIEKEKLLVLGLVPAGLWGWAAADLSGALDWARVEPSAGPRRSLKRLGLLDWGRPMPEEGVVADQLRPEMSPTIETGPDPSAAAAAGDGWWVQDVLAGWCDHVFVVVGLCEGLVAPPGLWSRRGREPEEREALAPKSNL
jgi:hypothetical protein